MFKIINDIIISRSRNQASRRFSDLIQYAEQRGSRWMGGVVVDGGIIATALAKGGGNLIWPLGQDDAVDLEEGRRMMADKELVAVLPHQ